MRGPLGSKQHGGALKMIQNHTLYVSAWSGRVQRRERDGTAVLVGLGSVPGPMW